MLFRNRLVVAACAALFAATPLAAQLDRSVVFGWYVGGYGHLLNLNDASAAHGTAHFTDGNSVGATLGLQLTRHVALHGDFTLTESRALGDESFAGGRFHRFFYGAHLEAGYPLARGVTPYLFLGGGAVAIDELGADATLDPFTRPAGMFGAGFSYAIPETHFELFAEGKSLVYRWDRGGFAPLLLYITTTGGYAYPVAVQTSRFNQTQWDFTYTLGLAFRFKTRNQHSAPAVTPSDE